MNVKINKAKIKKSIFLDAEYNSSEKHVSTGGSNTVLADSASPERRSTQFDGRKAMIIGNHPHKRATATCQGLEVTNVGPGLVFKNDNTYEEFFVFKPENVMWKS